MDQSVKQAIAKWPNVPAVYGWLSLDGRGRWHIHERGDADAGGPGALITSPQILAFIGRNYESDARGRWYFQNGPQRVYVRLDAAPYILRVADTGIGLVTHTTEPINTVDAWWLDQAGQLYARTDLGGGMVDGRDLETVLAQLHATPAETPLLEALETHAGQMAWQVSYPCYRNPASLHLDVAATDIVNYLGFIANPISDMTNA